MQRPAQNFCQLELEARRTRSVHLGGLPAEAAGCARICAVSVELAVGGTRGRQGLTP